ncbi:MAG: methyltransferase domain-containing protein [Legionella sp.]|nr:methyltransferase domain-containing protein [Legionella sp.]
MRLNLNLPTIFFKARSKEKEILDLGPDFYSVKEYHHCQTILFKINKLLGIFSHSKRFLKQFPPDITVLDVGCGGGLSLLNLSVSFPKINFIGCDISKYAIKMAENESKNYPSNKITFNLQHQQSLNLPENSVDIILATLVCHHIDDTELGNFFQEALFISRKAVLVNDLHRNMIPYLFYKMFSPLFRNRLINYDGLISIKRGFKREEICLLLEKANINHFTLKWRFPFCWSLILWKK